MVDLLAEKMDIRMAEKMAVMKASTMVDERVEKTDERMADSTVDMMDQKMVDSTVFEMVE